MDTNEHGFTPEQQERVDAIVKAVKEEFLSDDRNNSDEPKDIEDLKPEFMRAIKRIVKHSDSEALVAKVSMWGMDAIINMNKADEGIAAFLKGMQDEASSRS